MIKLRSIEIPLNVAQKQALDFFKHYFWVVKIEIEMKEYERYMKWRMWGDSRNLIVGANFN